MKIKGLKKNIKLNINKNMPQVQKKNNKTLSVNSSNYEESLKKNYKNQLQNLTNALNIKDKNYYLTKFIKEKEMNINYSKSTKEETNQQQSTNHTIHLSSQTKKQLKQYKKYKMLEC